MQPMAHYTLIALINVGSGRFPFVNVQFTKTHRPIPSQDLAQRNEITKEILTGI
jgi:hypothetical protein